MPPGMSEEKAEKTSDQDKARDGKTHRTGEKQAKENAENEAPA